jgi:hypothetical protein
LLVWFNWGEYAIWHFSPQLKVSMDGRRETVYSATTLQSYQDLIAGGPPAGAYFDRLNPDVVWLPARAPLNEHLAGRGWRPAFEGTGSIVWVRASDARPFAPPAPRLPACFPGP